MIEKKNLSLRYKPTNYWSLLLAVQLSVDVRIPRLSVCCGVCLNGASYLGHADKAFVHVHGKDVLCISTDSN